MNKSTQHNVEKIKSTSELSTMLRKCGLKQYNKLSYS